MCTFALEITTWFGLCYFTTLSIEAFAIFLLAPKTKKSLYDLTFSDFNLSTIQIIAKYCLVNGVPMQMGFQLIKSVPQW